MEGEKESILPSVWKEQIEGVHIKKREQEGVIKRDVDPYIIRVGIKRKEEVESSKKIGPAL